jgi:hypothetical protein
MGFQVPEDWVQEVCENSKEAMKNINIEGLKNMIAFQVRF